MGLASWRGSWAMHLHDPLSTWSSLTEIWLQHQNRVLFFFWLHTWLCASSEVHVVHHKTTMSAWMFTYLFPHSSASVALSNRSFFTSQLSSLIAIYNKVLCHSLLSNTAGANNQHPGSWDKSVEQHNPCCLSSNQYDEHCGKALRVKPNLYVQIVVGPNQDFFNLRKVERKYIFSS